MSKGKKIPAAMAVVRVPRAPGLIAAEGKLQLMERTRQLSDNGEKILAALMRIVTSSEHEKNIIEAADRLLAYGWGRPIETKVTADVSQPPAQSESLSILSSEQLEAFATRALPPQNISDAETHSEDTESQAPASEVHGDPE